MVKVWLRIDLCYINLVFLSSASESALTPRVNKHCRVFEPACEPTPPMHCNSCAPSCHFWTTCRFLIAGNQPTIWWGLKEEVVVGSLVFFFLVFFLALTRRFGGSCSQKRSTIDVNQSAGVCELQPGLIGIRGIQQGQRQITLSWWDLTQ